MELFARVMQALRRQPAGWVVPEMQFRVSEDFRISCCARRNEFAHLKPTRVYKSSPLGYERSGLTNVSRCLLSLTCQRTH